MFHLASVQMTRIARKPWVRVHQNPHYQPDRALDVPIPIVSPCIMTCCC